MDGQRGQFLSQDPVFLGASQNLTNPQSLNSYSYGNNSPITLSDPRGLCSGAFECGVNAYTFGTMDAATDVFVSKNATYAQKLTAGAILANVSVENTLFLGIMALSLGSAGILGPEIAANGALARAQINEIQTSVNAKAAQLSKNVAQGKAFQDAQFANFKSEFPNAVQQLPVRTNTNVRLYIDGAARDTTGQVILQEYKSSASARYTENQIKGFPSISSSGATEIGKGKPGFPPGTIIPPTTINTKRP